MTDSETEPQRSGDTASGGGPFLFLDFVVRCGRIVGIVSVLVALGGPTGPALGHRAVELQQATDGTSIERSLRAIFEKAGVRAAAWCVVKDGEVVSQNGFGFADADKARPVDAEATVFRAASNGKVFVALAALLVEAEGRLDLRADVNSILKYAKLANNFDTPVTLDHLLTHTGGFENRFLGGLAPSPESVIPLSEYLATRMPERVVPPGKWLSYSNHGMALALRVWTISSTRKARTKRSTEAPGGG